MFCKNVTSAGFAPFSRAPGSLVVRADPVSALRNPNRIRLPQGKGIHRASRPAPARAAMAIAHGSRLAGYGELHCSAKTIALVGLSTVHIASPYIKVTISNDS
jgi:hypothetical protein